MLKSLVLISRTNGGRENPEIRIKPESRKKISESREIKELRKIIIFSCI